MGTPDYFLRTLFKIGNFYSACKGSILKLFSHKSPVRSPHPGPGWSLRLPERKRGVSGPSSPTIRELDGALSRSRRDLDLGAMKTTRPSSPCFREARGRTKWKSPLPPFNKEGGLKDDDLVKSRHSRVGGNPGPTKPIENTGFPFPREWQKNQFTDFLRSHQRWWTRKK